MDPREKRIREQHPDWTDDQVNAELAKPADPPPAPSPSPEPDRDRAFAEQRRRADEAERRAKAAEDALAERARKEAEEQGRWKELAEQEKARADRLEADKAKADQRNNAERTASTLKFRDAGYALYLLEQQRVDLADAPAVKTALEQIAQDRKDLIEGNPPPPSGAPAGGTQPDPPKLTREQLAAMTPQQVAALDPKVVSEALAR
jgi:membrane protein involved in colicin uptake